MGNLLVIGANGYFGRYFCEHADARAEWKVIRGARRGTADVRCDLLDPDSVTAALTETKPRFVAVLVGSFTNDLAADLPSNVLTTHNLLQALRHLGLTATRVLVLGSAAHYGASEDTREEAPPNPSSLYGLSKELQHIVARFHASNHGLSIHTARLFNLLGPRMSSRLFPGSCYFQARELMDGRKTTIKVGFLDHTRDFVDVRDAAEACYRILVSSSAGATYNVGSGKGVTPRQILGGFLRELGLPETVIDSDPGAPGGATRSVANIERIRLELGWSPKFSLADSLEDMARALKTERMG